ncbi:MAG: glycosyltransferase [Blastochloris sp.]|nr:glycosyltransferase [Blastochloris sp.]
MAFVVCWPWFALRMWKRGRFWPGFTERFACYSREVRSALGLLQRPVWIHAVSVGEMMLARVLVRELRRLRPEQDVVITCTTSTARVLGDRELRDAHTVVLYSPSDLLPCVRAAFKVIRPCLILLMEQELWPNQLWEAERRGVPVWIVNARLSDRSWKRFCQWRGALSSLLSRLSFVGLQSERDRERFAQAGFPVHALFAMGSMKTDVADLAKADHGVAEGFRRDMGWKGDEEVLLAGSTHGGEEEILLRVYDRLRQTRPGLKLVLVPRHAERAAEVLELARKGQRSAVLRTKPELEAEIVVLNTTGELRSLYELATVVFMGKTLVSPKGKGGQNFLEAARVGVPIVTGPRVENFRNLVEDYLAAGALVRVADEKALEKALQELLASPEQQRLLGQKAQERFQSELGVGAEMARRVAAFLGRSDLRGS